VFDLAAAGAGDLKIVRTLAAESIPAPGTMGWSKEIVRHMLRNPMYTGRVVYGRTRTIDNGGRGRRVDVPKDDWTIVEVPALRIVPEAVWAAVQRRKAQTREHYLRAPDGRLMGKPEAGLEARHLLNGIARCGTCGGALTYMEKHRRGSYFCATYKGRATCTNSRGVPADPFETAICRALRAMLDGDRERTVALLGEQVERARREQTARGSERAQLESEQARLEKKIANLVTAIEDGRAPADVVAALTARRAEVETIKAKRAALAAAPPAFDKARWLERLGKFGATVALGPLTNPYNPVLFRQVLRAVGVRRIVVTRTSEGWTFTGMAHLGGIADGGGTREARPPSRPPPEASCAGEAGARTGRLTRSVGARRRGR